jgi:nucleoside-diphosphate-sugar epimerase
MCRKASELQSGDNLEVWGDGLQTRSFLYVDECVEAVIRFMEQNEFLGPVNIGSEEMVTINQLAKYAIIASEKDINIENISGDEFKNKYGFKCPVGVRGRNSDNKLYKEKMNWEPSQSLQEGIIKTYEWINEQVKNQKYIFESPDGGKTINKRVIN